MSTKDLFEKGQSLKFLKNKSQDDLTKDIESTRYLDAYTTQRNRFFPDIDFSRPSNFAHFGLAESYYKDSIERIYQTFPYDGSLTERIEWENESTYLDLYMYENEYPRTNGYVVFNDGSETQTSTRRSTVYSSSAPQYIFFTGGPHADSDGDYKSQFSAGPSKIDTSKANIYHTASQRTSNLELDLDKGVTVEFWLKKDSWPDSTTAEYFFDLFSSGSEGVSGTVSNNYGRLNIYSYETGTVKKQLRAQIVSASAGTAGGIELNFNHETGLDDIADGNWHHYAMTFKTNGSETLSNLYVDGVHKSRLVDTDTINAIDGTMIASLGALAGPISSSSGIWYSTSGETKIVDRGWGNVYDVSYDEFRYWKKDRNAEQIGRFYKDQVGGGTNTDNDKYNKETNPVDLGVYYKFNEGITEIASTDSAILDYSGRISNGTFIGYNTASRSTGSAMVLSKAAVREFKDPIIYSTHPEVSALKTNKLLTGSFYDHQNASSIFKSIPGWISEEDEEESGHLKYLTQIIASYFDTIFLQIQSLPKLKDVNYPYDVDNEKPLPFADHLLNTRGMATPELFADASILAKYLQRGEKKLFEKKLHEVKNTIYQNIYNNLIYIQKSKGTIKSLRNFLRCYGIDEEIVKFNIYASNDTYELKDTYSHTSVKKRYLDFDDLETRLTASSNVTVTGSFTATAYQYKDPNDTNSLSYIPGISSTIASGAMATIQTEVIFPKRSIKGDKNYQLFPSLTSSIFGLHAVTPSNTDLTFLDDDINFNIVAIKKDDDKRNVSFALQSENSVIPSLQHSSSFRGVYDNEKWNLAFRLRPTRYPFGGDLVDGSLDNGEDAYTVELYGVNYISNLLQNEFLVSGTISTNSAAKFFTKAKRLYVGASRVNYTGSLSVPSDVKISSTKFWFDYLDNETIQAHGKDASAYGTLHPYKNSNFAASTASLFRHHIPQIETLALNWTLDNVTGSDANGQFIIHDFASGSALDRTLNRYGWLSSVTKYNYSGRGDKFVNDPNYVDQAVDVEFVQTSKQKLPEVVNSDDFVKILSQQDDVVFTRDTTYIQHFFAVEKSMYQTISEEMLRFFATIVDFNNLIGDPINQYRTEYKRMGKLRDLFFEKVENAPDLEKFIQYYKWVDNAVAIMISELLPASANSTDFMRNMVESHILERNKYISKFPTLETKAKEPVSSLKGINEMLYNWKSGHAPPTSNVNPRESENCLWWKERAERDVHPLASGDANVDDNKNTIRKRIITEISASGPTLKTTAGLRYEGSPFVARSLTRLVHVGKNISLKLQGGSNPQTNQLVDYYKGAIKFASDDDFIYLDLDNEIKQPDCNDKEIPYELDKKKRRFLFRALTMRANELDSHASGTGADDLKYSDAKSTLLLPFSVYTSSLDTGYIGRYSDKFKLDFTNLHEDRLGRHGEIPMQGPFTEKHVGGMQYRHADLNYTDSKKALDTQKTRIEGWHLETFVDLSGVEYIFDEGFGTASYSGTFDTSVLNLPYGSVTGDPSIYELWQNGAGTEYRWTIKKGSTPTAGTGPAGTSRTFAYCEVLPARVGQTFGLTTPLIDLLDVESNSSIVFEFKYHMFGLGMGNLQIQASTDRNFATNVKDILTTWDYSATNLPIATSLAGQQHATGEAVFKTARAGTIAHGAGLEDFLGTRFYIRFLYTAGVSHLGDCAITDVSLYKGADTKQNSFKLFDPSYDDHRRPRSVYARQEYAKRPVNIRNIGMTSSSPTKIGNYLDRYEYISTVSSEANDPWFIKNSDQISRTTAEVLGPGTGSIEEILRNGPGRIRATLTNIDFTLLDRTYLTGSVRNRTRFVNKFSSPGGYEVMSRGFLDVEHETYSVYNAMPWRNNWGRKVYNSQLQAHQGRFGTSGHDSGSARVYGSEAVGTISLLDYRITGSASKHKRHRNNIEKYEYVPGLQTGSVDVVGQDVKLVSKYDNGFISRMIPRTDKQYSWITASLI